MKFIDKNFELVNIPIKSFYILMSGDQKEIEKLKNELGNSKVEQINDELKFSDFDNFTLLNYMMLITKYRNIKFTKVFDINNNEILLKNKGLRDD